MFEWMRKCRGGLGVLLILVGVVLLGTGGFFAYVGWSADVVPQEVTLRDVLANGPGKNRHLAVSDYRLASQYLTTGATVWLNMTPSNLEMSSEEESTVNKYERVMVISHSGAVDRLFQEGTLRGVVRSLSAHEEKLLSKRGSGEADYSRYLVIMEGREPASRLEIAIYCGVGLVLLALGAFLTARSSAVSAPVPA